MDVGGGGGGGIAASAAVVCRCAPLPGDWRWLRPGCDPLPQQGRDGVGRGPPDIRCTGRRPAGPRPARPSVAVGAHNGTRACHSDA